MFKIVIVEDELIAAEYLKEVLNGNGFDVLAVIDNGKEAMEEIPRLNPDLVLMDIMLKDSISGSEVALALKQNAPKTAIVFLTAYANDEMVEYAIESNSYGYLMKPYNEQEIINTIKVVLARVKGSEPVASQNVAKVQLPNNLTFDKKVKRLFKHTKEVRLGTKALALLEVLCQQPNVSISNEQICLHVWGEMKNSVTLRTLVFRIRAHIGNDVIENVNGLGYMVKSVEG